jgi:hypothetical protein
MRFPSRPARSVFPLLLSLAARFGVLLPVMVLFIVLVPRVVRAQEGPLDKSEPKGITAEEIIKRFAAKEKEFKTALDQYTYRQDVRTQTLDGDTPDGGEYREVYDVTFDEKGRKIKNVVFAPQNTLTRIGMTMEDFEDLENRTPFVLTSEEIPEYDILYVGQQKEDELNTYVFDIAPKQIVGKKRYFQGRIWVDDHDFQIVKSYGKSVPDTRKKHGKDENLFPKFTTWREQIDGKYWFPTFSRAEDTLKFSMGDVKIREIVKYTNYKRFGSKSTITYEGKEVEKAAPKAGGQTPAEPPKPQ